MAERSIGLQLRSRVSPEGKLELSLAEVETPDPGPDEVVIRIEASPINPSDIGLLLGPADLDTMKAGGDAAHPTLTASIPRRAMASLAARLNQDLPIGNEGAGTVVKAGPGAEALLGRVVALLGGGMYAQFRKAKVADCLLLPPGTPAIAGASCFVNPLTALGMVGTMRLEGHKALVHTVGASNLGQMLIKLCAEDGVPLVNIVRGPAQAALVRGLGAAYVCDTSAAGFKDDLASAMIETGATIAFDAVGGGRLASQILGAMETALNRTVTSYNRYGAATLKQVYIYGGLDTGPTEIIRSFGMAWSVGGWLLPYFLERIGPTAAQALRDRVVAELHTTFASTYTAEISLAQALDPKTVSAYYRRATGEKYIINPSKDIASKGQ